MDAILSMILRLLLILVFIASIAFGIYECIKGEVINGLLVFILSPLAFFLLITIGEGLEKGG